jgi:hypothetical protein
MTDAAEDPRRTAEIEIVREPHGDSQTVYLRIGKELWVEIEYSPERLAWCIQDSQGQCLRHQESIRGTAEDLEVAIDVGRSMIRDGSMPAPEEAEYEHKQRQKARRKANSAKREATPLGQERKALRDEQSAIWNEEYELGVNRPYESRLPLLESFFDALDFGDPDLWKSNSLAIFREKLVAEVVGEMLRLRKDLNYQRQRLVYQGKPAKARFEAHQAPPIQSKIDRAAQMLAALDPDGLVQVRPPAQAPRNAGAWLPAPRGAAERPRARHPRQGEGAMMERQVAAVPFQRAEKPATPAREPSKLTNRGKANSHKLTRVAFETSRLMEFCTERELVNQTGHSTHEWAVVTLKELVDNSLDASEENDSAPVINIEVAGDTITIEDNGPGLPDSTIAGIIDYSIRVSSREVYASPTRGAQGNALKCILAMAFVLDGERGETLIEARGIAHRIIFRVDQIRQAPMIEHERSSSPVTSGTKITLRLSSSRYVNLVEYSKAAFVRMVADYTWLNPHLTLRLTWNGAQPVNAVASDPRWNKWRGHQKTSAHWYDLPRFERYMAAHISDKKGRIGTVREFVSEFDGLSFTAKQKAILTEVGASHMSLASFFGNRDQVNHRQINRLLEAMKQHSKIVQPKRLGIIGRNHVLGRFEAEGGNSKTFKYQMVPKLDGNVPSVLELAFGVTNAGLEGRGGGHRQIRGLNWSPAIGDPFRSLGSSGQSLGMLFSELKVAPYDSVISFVSLAHPRLEYTDRGKSAVAID